MRRGLLLGAALLCLAAGAGWGLRAHIVERDLREQESALAKKISEGELQAAFKGAESLRRAWPARPEPTRLTGEILVYQRQNEAGVQRLLQAYRLAPAQASGLPELGLFMALARSSSFEADEQRLLDFLAEHEAARPQDPALPELRVVLASELLNSRDCPDSQREERRQHLRGLVEQLQPGPEAPSSSWYHLAEAQLLLGETQAAITTMRRGLLAFRENPEEPGKVASSTSERWDHLTMALTLVFLDLQAGRSTEARAGIERYLRDWMSWKAAHHGKLLPSFEYLALASRARLGEQLSLPRGYDDELARVARQGVLEQFGATGTRRGLRALNAALDSGDDERALSEIADLLAQLTRDLGCISENLVIRPHLMAMLLERRAGILGRQGRSKDARLSLDQARMLLPDDPWLRVDR